MDATNSSTQSSGVPTQPVMDVVPPRADYPRPALSPKPDDLNESIDLKAVKSASVVKPPKAKRNGLVLAIIATVIVVLGIAALMVYAYLRSNHVS